MKRVKVDFSTTVKDGLIRANQQRASELLYEGDEVEAFDPAEDMEFVGVVDHLSDDGRFAYLQMRWEDNPPAPPVSTPTFAYVTQTLSVSMPTVSIGYECEPEIVETDADSRVQLHPETPHRKYVRIYEADGTVRLVPLDRLHESERPVLEDRELYDATRAGLMEFAAGERVSSDWLLNDSE